VSDETTELPEGCPYPLDNDGPADVDPDAVTEKEIRVASVFVTGGTAELPEGTSYPPDDDNTADVELDEVTGKVTRVTPVFVFGKDVALLTYPLERAVEYPKDADVASVADEPELVETRL
jgi:hypothetical protein